MATIADRPFSKNYSGLINQSVIAAVIFVVCITSHELMKRKRRGKHEEKGLGSVESWEFGYLFQGRSWAKKPSPPIAQGWLLSWVPQAIKFPKTRFTEIRGVDAALYVRFLKGCVLFVLIHTLTTFPILFPIHVTFAGDTVSPKSMTRASISSLVNTPKGVSLLWIHLLLLIWVTLTWMTSLWWICRDTFRNRALKLQEAADRAARDAKAEKDSQYHPHPHPQYPFQALPPLDQDHSNKGIRVRTVMVTNIPIGLRSEKELKEYFEYYLSRPLAKTTIGVTSAAQPGLFERLLGFMYNKSKHLASRVYETRIRTGDADSPEHPIDKKDTFEAPIIERIVLVHKMSELASLLERREDTLRLLETAHIKLARNALEAVSEAMGSVSKRAMLRSAASRMSFGRVLRHSPAESVDIERGNEVEEGAIEGESRMELLVRTLAPYVMPPEEFKQLHPLSRWLRTLLRADQAIELLSPQTGSSQKSPAIQEAETVWNALLSLPRSTLDAYQPLVRLSALFIGKTVPAIDYYTAKLKVLNSLVTEQRSQPPGDFPPMSTAFVTFADPADARRACKYLAGHPNNPLSACLVTMAPSYEDLDWTRLMKSTYKAEFVKDWVVDVGVWGFTIFWVFPVSSIVGLVSIQNISAFWPGLKRYLDKHEFQSEVLQSFVPTLLVAILTLLIPPVLLLIAKKAHTIVTLSSLHDRIMTRYYKFLIVNVLVFFCVGTAALQSFLVSFKAASGHQILEDVSDSFPTAGPFYVGWLIFTMAMHGGLELALFGLPLVLYPSTKRQVTPRKRAVGIRPRTFNYYYWLPNHLLVIHILMLFAVLNPLVIPSGLIYFCVEAVVVKNQLLHVYARNYEGNGQSLLIRLIRYSSDGLILAQAVFMAYMIVLKQKANVGVAAVLIVKTALFKVGLTRFCRAKFERDDLAEARILCGSSAANNSSPMFAQELSSEPISEEEQDNAEEQPQERRSRLSFWTWKFSNKIGFSYAATLPRRHQDHRRKPNPFQPPRSSADSGVPLHPCSSTAGLLKKVSSDPEPVLPSITHGTIHESPSELTNEQLTPPEQHDSHALVSPHPRHPVWDDEPNPDTPYDNPYYTRPFSDTLWLPRDPLDILNLDDTIDMRISITSEPGAGRLGPLPEDEFVVSQLTSVFATSFGSVGDDTSSTHPSLMQLDGSEVINLPAGIVSRVESIGRETIAVEEAGPPRRPSMLGPRRSSNSGTRSVNLRRQSTGHERPAVGFRAFSLQSTSSLQRPPPNLSLTIQRQRSISTSVLGLGLPSEHQARMWPTSMSIRSGAATAHNPSPGGGSSIISTREALVGEAIAEEQVVAEERLRQEKAERERAKESRSWLTAWMYSNSR